MIKVGEYSGGVHHDVERHAVPMEAYELCKDTGRLIVVPISYVMFMHIIKTLNKLVRRGIRSTWALRTRAVRL